MEAGGGVVSHGRRLRATLWLFPRGGERERVFVLFPSPLFFVPSFSVRLTRDHSLLFSVLFKKTCFCSFCFPVVSLSLQFFSGPLLSPQPFFAASSFFFGFFSIYRGRTGAGTISSAPGSGFRGWLVGHHPRQQGVVSLLSAGGRPMTLVGGPTVWGLGLFGGDVGEREAGSFFQKQSFSFYCRFGGRGRRKGNSAVQNGTVRSFLFFLMYETASF